MEISRTAPPLGGPVVAAQEWRDVAFVHWRVPQADVAPLLPAGVVPDVFDGSSWVGLVAFRLEAARIGPLPPAVAWGSFTEVNVRLYGVDARGRRGVVFRSLEASSLPAVLAARTLFSLPYMWARTQQRPRPDGWEYASRRISQSPTKRGPGFQLAVAIDRTRTVDDELSVFLTARWSLFQRRFGRTRWLPNEHEPWMLHPARLISLRDELCAAAGLRGLSARAPDSVLFSPGVHARFGRGQRLSAASSSSRPSLSGFAIE
ncbi:hypothetical protein SAMN04487846_3621 [Microbacterium sp. cf046]|uniref:YqjF family protein n=1 Tax=Microbacterium sp. cf046 TaxID=1761803 RepID=UPI0008E89D27|nr:DUF2071 domain-containing protein [Microbacterium sp. cf046]SFS17656.1 hypothetical protein SAMN04487846_3621 [Microbacterium sp. cf046]